MEIPVTPNPAEEPDRSRLLGKILLERGFISEAALEEALASQRESGQRLGEILLERGVLSSPELGEALAAQAGIELSPENGFGSGLRSELGERARLRRGAQRQPDTAQPASSPRSQTEDRDGHEEEGAPGAAATTSVEPEPDPATTMIGPALPIAESGRELTTAPAGGEPCGEEVGSDDQNDVRGAGADIRGRKPAGLKRSLAKKVDELDARGQAVLERRAAHEEQQAAPSSRETALAERQQRLGELGLAGRSSEEQFDELLASRARSERQASEAAAKIATLQAERERLARSLEELRARLGEQGREADALRRALTNEQAARRATERARSEASGESQTAIREGESAATTETESEAQAEFSPGRQQETGRRTDGPGGGEAKQLPQLAGSRNGGLPARTEHAAAQAERTPHLLLLPASGRYQLREREGPTPARGETVELEEPEGRFVVVKVAHSPLPDDARPCAYLERES